MAQTPTSGGPSTTVPAMLLRAAPRVLALVFAVYVAATADGWLRGLAVFAIVINVLGAASWARYVRTGIPAGAVGVVPPAYRGGSHAVWLEAAGERRIEVIKVVRELSGAGLKEAKELVENAPGRVVDGLTEDGAGWAAGRLESAGATASVRTAEAPEPA